MYTEPIPHVVSKEVPPLSEAPEFLKTIAAPAVVDSSVASGTDRGVSESVAEVPAPAAPSADPYEHIRDFFTVAADEPEWYKDLRDNMMEMFRDTFTDNEGEAVAVPDIKQPRIGYGPLGDQQFPEACSACETALGPQGEPIFRFNENHDEKGQFGSGGAVKLQHQAFEKDGDTKVEGDVKTTKYTAPNHSITVEHNTKENKITIKHLDKEGNLLVQQTHDSVGAARKELQTQGIDHKFYAA